MKVAHIVPDAYLHLLTDVTDYHLVLSFRLKASGVYRDYYTGLSSDHFLILDNSAHELGTGHGGYEYYQLAEEIGAQELVLPDRLFMGDDSYELSYEAANDIEKHLEHNPDVGYVVVPQGRTIDEWYQCMKRQVEIPGVQTVGLSKDYHVWDGGLELLVDLITDAHPFLNIHLLGLSRVFSPGIFGHAEQIRGVDSSKPAVAAMLGKTWLPGVHVGRRPGGFFEADKIDPSLVLKCVQNFKYFATMAGERKSNVDTR